MAAPAASATQWLATPAEAARIGRVESDVPAVELDRESPAALMRSQWMATYNVPGLSVAVFEKGAIVCALTVFRANIRLYPADAHAYDSLGEAQMAAGDKPSSIASYRKSLELDPQTANATKVLEKLGVR